MPAPPTTEVSERVGGLRALGWAALIALVLLQLYGLYGTSAAAGVELFAGADKVGHLVAFAAPAAVAALLRARVVVLALGVHALLAEPLQGWLTSDRVVDPWDAVANLVGVVVGVLVARGLRNWWGRRS